MKITIGFIKFVAILFNLCLVHCFSYCRVFEILKEINFRDFVSIYLENVLEGSGRLSLNEFTGLLFLLEFDDEPLNVFLLRDPNEVLEGSGVLFSNSSTLSGFSSMVTGLTLEAAGLILDLNLDLLARDPKNND